MKPYQQIPILECGEPLVPIPPNTFAIQHPHPYVELAAPYGTKSPYLLREGVLKQLHFAQILLQERHHDWQIQIVDAYRPIAVQQFMVDYTFCETVRTSGIAIEQLTETQRLQILEQVYQFWAVPSHNPATPPPHSTGAAIDITLVNAAGIPIEMGSPIDELSCRSYPDYFADCHSENIEDNSVIMTAEEAEQRSLFHRNRQTLKHVMIAAGFRQHPNEWWHFSLGDQMWAWLMNQETANVELVARYGAL